MESRPSQAARVGPAADLKPCSATRDTTPTRTATSCVAAWILPVISRKGSPNIKGMGKLRYVVEQTFALLHHFKRLAVRWERRTDLHDAFVSLACSLICWRRLKKARS